MATRLGGLLVTLAVLAAACSNSDTDNETLIDLDGPSATVPPTTTTTTTPTTSTTTTTSTPTTTTAPPERAEETPPPPPLTASEEGTIEAEVEAAFWRMEQVRLAALAMTPFDAATAGLDSVIADPWLSDFTAARERASGERNEAARLAGDELETHILSIAPSETGDLVSVTVCYRNDLVVYNFATGEIIDDSVATQERIYLFARGESGWVAFSAQSEFFEEGITGCLLDV